MAIVLIYATGGDCSRSIESFRRIGGVEPVVIGAGEPFSWQGRVRALHRWCREHPGTTVICADGYDTCCVRRVSGDTYSGVWFSAEANCWPDASLAERYPPCTTRYRFLNGGLWMANTDAFAGLVEQHGLLDGVTDDQLAYTQAFLAGAAMLDTDCDMFHNRYLAEDDWEISDGIYWVTSTGRAPTVVHGNGGSGIERVWEAFGV